MSEAQEVRLFYRRKYGFPLGSEREVEVESDPGNVNGSWDVLEFTKDEDGVDIDCSLGLDGELTDLWLIVDAFYVAAAIRRHIGLANYSARDFCWWSKAGLDQIEDQMAENAYFEMLRNLFGEVVCEEARKAYFQIEDCGPRQ